MSDQPFFLTQNSGFAEITPADDYLHPEVNAKVSADTLTETQYLGFVMPEHNIQLAGYLWHHPNLGTVTGGIWAWQGNKAYTVAAEMCDIRCHMSDKALANDLHCYEFENGYAVEVLEPLKRHRMRYHDEQRQNSLDIEFEAVSPAVMFGDGNHFEQAMRARGTLTLRGHEYQVNSYGIRDRSWGKPRPEANAPLPPVSWMTAVFSDDFAVNCTCFDDTSGIAKLEGRFALPKARLLNGGWIWKNGKVTRIVSAYKKVERDPATLRPNTINLDVTDETGDSYMLTGTRKGSNIWSPWINIYAVYSQFEWRCGDLVTHGECQDGIFHDYTEAMLK